MKKEKSIPKDRDNLGERVRRVRLVVFDVDGVLTDGTIWLMPDGREMKAFNALDGTGIKYLERAGIATAILSGRRSGAVNHRAREVGMRYVLQGYKRNLAGLTKLARLAKVPPERMCFVGDDLPDIPVMERAGFAVAVAGARPEVIRAAHWVTATSGGRGAAREVAEKILKAQGKWHPIIARYGL
jgi:3-deoxy-D-manno-octulosonate 8-phosphate phosphatase (KDO 8-P phosphatase)